MKWLIGIGVSFACVFLVAIILGQVTKPHTPKPAKLPYTVSPQTTAITGPLLPDGSPDYFTALNAEFGKGVTPENNGFIVWLKVAGPDTIQPAAREELLKLSSVSMTDPGAKAWQSYADFLKSRHPSSTKTTDEAAAELESAAAETWAPDDRPDLAAFLKSQDSLLALAAQAADKPRWWIPAVPLKGHSLISIAIPTLGPSREVARALLARATFKMAGGDFDGFLADEMASKKFARQIARGQSLIERLVGIGIDGEGTDSLGALAGAGLFSGEQCKRITAALDALPPMPSMAYAVDLGERWTRLQFIESIAASDVNAFDEMVMPTDPKAKEERDIQQRMFTVIDRDAVDWDAVLRRANEVSDETVQAMRQPDYESMWDQIRANFRHVEDAARAGAGRASIAKLPNESRDQYTEYVGGVLISLTQASVDKAEALWRWDRMKHEMVRAALAANAFKDRTGKWPDTLNQLVPADLTSVPQDVNVRGFRPVSYLVTPKGIRVYSIGQDNKDDNGVRDLANGKDDLPVGVK